MDSPFLIDECLSPALAGCARARGHTADHVAHRGWGGRKDRQLLPLIQRHGYVLVTNNRLDWLKLHSGEDIHNGLVVIVPNVEREEQVALFGKGLDHLEELADLINKVLEIYADGTVTIGSLSTGRFTPGR